VHYIWLSVVFYFKGLDEVADKKHKIVFLNEKSKIYTVVTEIRRSGRWSEFEKIKRAVIAFQLKATAHLKQL